jgi:ribosomal protein S18 acetylase RimI-like enzyme
MSTQPRSGEEIRWQEAAEKDADMLADWIRRYYEYDGIPFHEREIRAGLSVLSRDPSLGRAWLIILGSEVIGYTIIGYDFDLEVGGRLATVTDLFLAPQHRRKGLGRRTLEFVAEFCRASGVRALQLQVERDNLEAQALYKSFGFQAADRIPMCKRLSQD